MEIGENPDEFVVIEGEKEEENQLDRGTWHIENW